MRSITLLFLLSLITMQSTIMVRNGSRSITTKFVVQSFHIPTTTPTPRIVSMKMMTTRTVTTSMQHKRLHNIYNQNNNKDTLQPLLHKMKRKFLYRLLSSSSLSSSSDDEQATTITTPTTPTVYWTTDKVRQTFIDYFTQQIVDHPHTYVASSSCVPLNDPTLLFTNAGMNQFKSIFLGQVEPNTIYETLDCVVNSQKCIRAGGKHNDLDDVGKDTYHHTFFEMLGTWSFNNAYNKSRAIYYAYDILTNVYQLDPKQLYATYFEGDDSVPADIEARDIWLQYLPESHVIASNAKDNFWEMGETGPCGPCTEIHYDRLGYNGRNAAQYVNQDDPNVIEIWNIVFIQYNREYSTSSNNNGMLQLSTLPAQHIDTGMGLERLTSILQNVTSNYDIDCFLPIFTKLQDYSSVGPYTKRVYGDDIDVTSAIDENITDTSSPVDAYIKDTAYRAIADHVRTLSFAIADGATPNNEGRGYVLRRILRRAARYGQQVLGIRNVNGNNNNNNGFLTQIIPTVIDVFGPTYPELRTAQDRIIEIIQEEEQSFSTMLDRGIKYFTELKDTLIQEEHSTVVTGEQAFFLYDSLGFPIDLTEQMAQESSLTVDVVGFQNAMEEQKQRSRMAQKYARFDDNDMVYPPLELIAEQTAYLSSEQQVHATDDGMKYNIDMEQPLPATIMDIYTVNGFISKNKNHVNVGDYIGLILDKTSFYSEAGGQETDTGRIELVDSTDGSTVVGVLNVMDVQVYGGFVLHKGIVESGNNEWSVGAHVNCQVDYTRRKQIVPNHSMTHVLNAALRQVLGDGVEQRGSLCNAEKLRFDFSHKKAMTLSELQQVESICQTIVANKEVVTSEMMSLQDAKQIDGVRAVFGEVYPDPVRVVRIGTDTSIEFCGGTHMTNTAEAEAFVIVEETAVAKGIRRITAVTKSIAKDAIQRGIEFTTMIDDLEKLDPTTTADLDKQAGAIRKELDMSSISACLKAELRVRIETVQKLASDAKSKAIQQRVDTIINDVKIKVNDAIAAKSQFVVVNVDIGSDAKSSQKITNAVKKMAPDLPFLAISEEEPGSGGKVFVFAIVPDAMYTTGPEESHLRANEWVLSALEKYDGRGGGKPNGAQAQAQSCDDINDVMNSATLFVQNKLSAIAVNSNAK